MQAYPLIRVKWSNEHIMAALFGILILYMLPGWYHNPVGIPEFLAILVAALLIDTVFNIIKNKQILCAVSSAVTAGIFQILTPGVPLYGRLLGIVAALVIGKHLWGGTGKNPINPALTGVIFVSLFFTIKEPVFTSSPILLAAILFSLPFIYFRPFAATGFIVGMTGAMLFTGNFSITSLIFNGVFFWGCIILTDPVTITSNPLLGWVIGVLGGIIPMELSNTVFNLSVTILIINFISSLAAKSERKMHYKHLFFFMPKKVKINLKLDNKFYDLAGEEASKMKEVNYNTQKILERIEKNEVFGFGGAGFPTIRKIKTLIEAQVSKKHLIVNAVECDPGLLHDKWLLNNKFHEISKGIEILCKCEKFASATLAIKDKNIFAYLKAKHNSQNFKLKRVHDYFPVGAEKFLIYEVLGKRMGEAAIPAHEGILVLNLQTVYSVYEAVCLNQKADSRFITIADMKHKIGYVTKVKLGTQIPSILESILPQGGAAFYGGGVMQCRSASDGDKVDKSTNFLAISDSPRYKESQLCSRCGFCKLVCPSGLIVDKVAELVDKGLPEATRYFNPKNCLQCGRCSSVCLAGRNLSNRMKIAREC